MRFKLIIVIYFTIGMVLLRYPVAVASEILLFLDKNPQLKEKLMEWEMAAPADVKKDIAILTAGNAVEKYYAADRIEKRGASAKGAISALIKMFSDTTVLTYGGNSMTATSPAEKATKALGRIGSPAVEPLISVLKDDPTIPRIRSYAARALGEIKDPRAVEPLIDGLKDEHPWVLESAASALGEIKTQRAVEALIEALTYNSGYACKDATTALGVTKDPQAVEPLIEVLKNTKNILCKWMAARALGEIGDLRAVDPLIEAMRGNDDRRVGSSASNALVKIKDPRAVEAVIEALKDKSASVRENAAYGLGMTKDLQTVEPLIEALKDESVNVRNGAEHALGKITGKNYGRDYDAWSIWWRNQGNPK